MTVEREPDPHPGARAIALEWRNDHGPQCSCMDCVIARVSKQDTP